jgi:hypothetical protein
MMPRYAPARLTGTPDKAGVRRDTGIAPAISNQIF